MILILKIWAWKVHAKVKNHLIFKKWEPRIFKRSPLSISWCDFWRCSLFYFWPRSTSKLFGVHFLKLLVNTFWPRFRLIWQLFIGVGGFLGIFNFCREIFYLFSSTPHFLISRQLFDHDFLFSSVHFLKARSHVYLTSIRIKIF